ncbi:MAG: enoyl-CoA hydratase/isomerase family protein [Myxococcales bacterium]|nr:MAG: enoyl-CoA hydratase/isomerase family protein [Myxococcales bacterium]
MDYQGKTICCALRDSVLEVELHRAPCNEIGLETLDELEVLADYIQSASSLPPLVIYSSLQSGFCAGADLKALYHFLSDAHTAEEKQVALEQVRDFLNRIHRVFNIIDSAPTTTIAALHGPVFGGGFELALTCDVMVADASSRFVFLSCAWGWFLVLVGFRV